MNAANTGVGGQTQSLRSRATVSQGARPSRDPQRAAIGRRGSVGRRGVRGCRKRRSGLLRVGWNRQDRNYLSVCVCEREQII